MRRRDFIKAIAGSAAAWPLSARAQQPGLPVVGFLHSTSAGPNTGAVSAFREGLKQAGYVEGQNVAIEFRWAEGHYDRLPALATDLVRERVAVIAALGGTGICNCSQGGNLNNTGRVRHWRGPSKAGPCR